MGEAGNDHSGSSVLKQGPRAHCTGLHPDTYRVSPTRETPQPLWAVPVLSHLHSEVVIHVQVELPVHHFLPVASCPGAQCHREEPGSLHPFDTLPSDTIDMAEVPLTCLFSSSSATVWKLFLVLQTLTT